MKRIAALIVGLAGTSSVALASNLNVSVQTACGNTACPNEVEVGPGGVVNYQVVGILSDDVNEGLALVGFDLAFEGGDLQQADAPDPNSVMGNFASGGGNNKGISNPAGYGGTLQNGVLKQVGGGQNTIKNTADNAPFPVGTVMTGVGQPPNPVILATGSLTAPETPGDYDLVLSNLFGNVIKDGETGEVFFKTEAFGVGTIANLVVHVAAVPSIELAPPTSPACDSSLWRSAGNEIVLTFSGPIAAPPAGAIKIRQILAAGAYDATDHSHLFTFTVENGNQLRVKETGTVLTHRNWYSLTHEAEAWGGVGDFKVDFVVQVGDVNNDGRVLAADVSSINACVPCANVQAGCANVDCGTPQNRREMSGDNRILAADVSIANARVPSTPVAKPSGHTCFP